MIRNLVLGVLVLWLSFMGIICGILCLLCLLLLLFWQGLSISTIVLAMLCLFCLGLATILARNSLTTRNEQVRRNDQVGLLRRSLRWFLRRREISVIQDPGSNQEMSDQKGFAHRSYGNSSHL